MPTAVAVAVIDGATRQKILDALAEVPGAVVNYQQTLEAVLGLRPRPQVCLLDSAVGTGLVPAITPAALFDVVEELCGGGVAVIVLCNITDRVLTQSLFRLGARTIVGYHASAPAITQVARSVIASLNATDVHRPCLYEHAVVF